MTRHTHQPDAAREALTEARNIVVKLGTQVISDPSGKPRLDVDYIHKIAGQIASLHHDGYRVALVCSGAVGAGCYELGIEDRPTDLAALQAVAAVGQRGLMTLLHDAFEEHGLRVGQVLVTRTDFDDRGRFLNIRNCVAHLASMDCIPVINENDTVSVDELRFGDNDMLAALVCNAMRADALILLSVVEGLLDESGQRVPEVKNLSDVLGMARTERSRMGTGGVLTKLEAARLVTEAGESAVFAHGRSDDVLRSILSGHDVGTLFLPRERKLDSRQRWIALTARPTGTVTIDDGAAKALRQRGKSLLATGITETTGRFEAGEVLMIRDVTGHEVARGLSNYTSSELRLIIGRQSDEFAEILGRGAYAEVVHRDNMVVLAR